MFGRRSQMPGVLTQANSEIFQTMKLIDMAHARRAVDPRFNRVPAADLAKAQPVTPGRTRSAAAGSDV
jgi:hypothetical protein